jgi:hypothetical protein
MNTVGGKKLLDRFWRHKTPTRSPTISTLSSRESERTNESEHTVAEHPAVEHSVIGHPVVELDRTNFEDIITNSKKDVVVEFYTPEVRNVRFLLIKNASCKAVEPIYQLLGKKYGSEDTIIIARCNAREVPAKICYVPTIKLFPGNANYLPVEYHPDLDVQLDGYIKFIEEERTPASDLV